MNKFTLTIHKSDGQVEIVNYEGTEKEQLLAALALHLRIDNIDVIHIFRRHGLDK